MNGKAGAPLGNQNHAGIARPWAKALKQVLERKSKNPNGQRRALIALAEVLVDKALEGDMGALKELGDRLDGKPAQAITTDGNAPVMIGGNIIFHVAQPIQPRGTIGGILPVLSHSTPMSGDPMPSSTLTDILVESDS